MGGLAIERANRSLLFAQFSVTLWLVPSEPIREQTLRALREPSDLLHQLVFSALGDVAVLEVDEALRLKPSVLNSSNVIIVATMQSFKQEDMDRLAVYKQNSDMAEHFDYMNDPKVKGRTSLAEVLRMRHPFVVVDEAHNQGTPLAFETLARFEPSAILELTATPDRSRQPSNVLFSVGASALQAAEMIKLPLELIRRESWQDAMRDAIACLNKLQTAAENENSLEGDYIRPIMLIQAERRDPDHETLVPEKVRQALIQDFLVPENEVAIATGATDEITGKNLLSKDCAVRFIITVDKLREGWDCPFAYVLCSFRNTNSATAAEQILGRILRMPHAKRKQNQDLNEAYAFVTSSDLQSTVENLRDGLVKNGFERQEANNLIHASEEALQDDLFHQDASITFTSPELPEPEAISPNLESKLEIAPESSSITLKASLSPEEARELESIFRTPEGKEAIRKAVAQQLRPVEHRIKTPAEQGELFKVPLLTVRQGDLWEAFEETHLLQCEWRLLDYSPELTSDDFKKLDMRAQGGRFELKEEEITFKYLDNIEAQLALFEFQADWTHTELVSWLEKNIPDDTIIPDEKAAYLNKATHLLVDQRGFTIKELVYSKFRLRAALENKISAAKRDAIKKAYQSILFKREQFQVNDQFELVLKLGKYAYDWIYQGFTELPRHFFPAIGNLKADGEEFRCALFLAKDLGEVHYWVRNVERKPTSFSLQTSTDRFYPDFVCKLTDGRILAVEYKNSKDWDSADSKEKREIGDLWEKRSNGKCLFIMPCGMEWAAIRRKVAR